MAHFAQLDDTGTVIRVDVINNDVLDNLPFPDSEPAGQAFMSELGLQGRWLQTSYSGAFRGRFAGIGYVYDDQADEFIDPRPPGPPIGD